MTGCFGSRLCKNSGVKNQTCTTVLSKYIQRDITSNEPSLVRVFQAIKIQQIVLTQPGSERDCQIVPATACFVDSLETTLGLLVSRGALSLADLPLSAADTRQTGLNVRYRPECTCHTFDRWRA
jgi:hypothetical protein